MREQQAHVGLHRAQRLQQNVCGPGLAQRYGMQPYPLTGVGLRLLPFLIRIPGEALVYGMQVQRLSLPAAAQFTQQQRPGQLPEKVVQSQNHSNAAEKCDACFMQPGRRINVPMRPTPRRT